MIEKILKNASLKNTKQRYSILLIIESSVYPITAENIFKILKNEKKDMDLSTVYRTLSVLCEKNVLLKILKSDGIASYQLNNSSHNHYITCYCCHSSVLIDKCPIKELSEKIAKKTGYAVTGHTLELIGLCPKCLEQKMNNTKNK